MPRLRRGGVRCGMRRGLVALTGVPPSTNEQWLTLPPADAGESGQAPGPCSITIQGPVGGGRGPVVTTSFFQPGRALLRAVLSPLGYFPLGLVYDSGCLLWCRVVASISVIWQPRGPGVTAVWRPSVIALWLKPSVPLTFLTSALPSPQPPSSLPPFGSALDTFPARPELRDAALRRRSGLFLSLPARPY